VGQGARGREQEAGVEKIRRQEEQKFRKSEDKNTWYRV
jgi:hypothetical protein